MLTDHRRELTPPRLEAPTRRRDGGAHQLRDLFVRVQLDALEHERRTLLGIEPRQQLPHHRREGRPVADELLRIERERELGTVAAPATALHLTQRDANGTRAQE